MGKLVEQSEPGKLRIRREDCDRVKHDTLFSDWKVLVGASDWQDHAAGKEGVSRYRLHNLPSPRHALPGVYELGIFPRRSTRTVVAKQQRGGSRKVRREDVVPVYVGEAENVRQRLQRYGQAGSHLEASAGVVATTVKVEAGAAAAAAVVQKVVVTKCGGAAAASEEPSCLGGENGALQGHQLFSRVFAEGRAIVFRWALTESKEAAKRVEQDLLAVFDYAWNREKNGSRRPHDVYSKLHLGEDCGRVSCFGAVSYLAYLKWILSGRHSRGVVVAVSNPNQVLKQQEMLNASVLKTSETLQLKETWERKEKDRAASRASCKQEGRRVSSNRAGEQDRRLLQSSRGEAQPGTAACGFVLEDGSDCMVAAPKGRRRCSAHKGMRVKPTVAAAAPRRRREVAQST